VQNHVKEVFNSTIITADIQTQLSEFIVKCEKEVPINAITSLRDVPQVVKAAIIKGDKKAKEKEAKRKAEMTEKYGNEQWGF
jgi:hypothetical protein